MKINSLIYRSWAVGNTGLNTQYIKDKHEENIQQKIKTSITDAEKLKNSFLPKLNLFSEAF